MTERARGDAVALAAFFALEKACVCMGTRTKYENGEKHRIYTVTDTAHSNNGKTKSNLGMKAAEHDHLRRS